MYIRVEWTGVPFQAPCIAAQTKSPHLCVLFLLLRQALVKNQLVGPAYEEIDWDSRWPRQESYNDKLLRDVITQVACTSGHSLCQRSASYQYDAWFFKP